MWQGLLAKKWKASIFSEQMWLFILRASGIRCKAVVRWFLAGSLYAHQFRINNRRCLTCSWGKLDWFEHSYSVKVKIPIAVINLCLVLVGSFSIMRNTKVFKRTVSKSRGKLIIKMYSGTCKSMKCATDIDFICFVQLQGHDGKYIELVVHNHRILFMIARENICVLVFARV